MPVQYDTKIKDSRGNVYKLEVFYSADLNCEHELDERNWSGVKCKKCTGWFCY